MMMAPLHYDFINRIKSLPFVESVWLYGSRARGDGQPRSDIDIAVLCPNASNGDWLLVLDIVEDADTLLKIDIIRLDNIADERLKQNIDRDKVQL